MDVSTYFDSVAFGGRAQYKYRRRQPEKTLLYNVIRENLNTFLEYADRRAGGPLPKYVRAEFSRFLDCGILGNGFARVRCAECGHDTVVGFS